MLSGTELKQVDNPDSFSVSELKGVDATGGQIGKIPRTQHSPGGKPPHVDARLPRDVELAVRHPEVSDKVSPTANDKVSILDRFVMAVVVVGIVVFAAFQISKSVTAHENPATKSTVEVLPRKYPGLMICPFSRDIGSNIGVCPKWSPVHT
jgi:hypothetical protein